MKYLLLILIFNIMFLNCRSQNYVYDSDGHRIAFESEDIDIIFKSSSVSFPQKGGAEFAPALIALLPSVVDIAFQLTSSSLENRIKKFTADYSKQKSYMEAGKSIVPDIIFYRAINNEDKALEISFKAERIPGLEGMIYYIEYIELKYSAAKAKKRKNKFDYSIELKPTFLIDGEKKVQELSPMTISSVKFGKTTFEKNKYKHRTDIIPLPAGAVFTEFSIKIIETNPSKVRAEKILSIWNENKESAKTIINNFLPKEDEEDDNDESEGNNQESNNNASVGND